jgi:outer membrane protein OmpA-like peptidoglycan-associated protein
MNNNSILLILVLFCSWNLAAQDSLSQKNQDKINQLKERISKIENKTSTKDPQADIDRLLLVIKTKSDSIDLLLKKLNSESENGSQSASEYTTFAKDKSLTFVFNRKETNLDFSRSSELDVLMKKYDGNSVITIKGHADKTGLEENNIKFSMQRAKNLQTYIVSKYNIDPSKIKAIWYGSQIPLPQSEQNGIHLNRRVEIILN